MKMEKSRQSNFLDSGPGLRQKLNQTKHVIEDTCGK